MDAYSFSFETTTGLLELSQFRGRPLLVVNTASRCGFTPQYEALEKVHQLYKDQGLVVIGVPSNDFGGQEPGNDAEIQTFVCDYFRVTFPVVSKVHVLGPQAHPFYQWIGENTRFWNRVRWNFQKYLINRHGVLARSFSSVTNPDSARVHAAIRAVCDELSQ